MVKYYFAYHRSFLTVHSFKKHSVMTEDTRKLSMKFVLNFNIYIIFKFKSNRLSSKQLQKLEKKA